MPRYLQLVSFLVSCCVGVCPAQPPAQILRESGVRGGLVVHLGCGDGRWTAGLRAGNHYLVQGLDEDPSNVRQAREHFASRGLYGTVTADTFDGDGAARVERIAAEHAQREGNQTQWLRRIHSRTDTGTRAWEMGM